MVIAFCPSISSPSWSFQIPLFPSLRFLRGPFPKLRDSLRLKKGVADDPLPII
jgi:hypothetical protein